MSDVHLRYISDAYVQVLAERSTIMELAEALTFKTENYKFDPRYKSGYWDGTISLLNKTTGLVYAGLAQRIKKFCDRNDYSFSFDDELYYDNVSEKQIVDHIESLDLPDWMEVRDYQVESVVKCIRSKRRTLISPTSSGKSAIIYFIHTWYNRKSLIIVPRVGLVTQFEQDLISYGYKGKIETSIGGLDPSTKIDCDVLITTWQSLSQGKKKMPKAWYDQFGVVFGDEAHLYKATSLINIMSSAENIPYRFGTTGTLDDVSLNKATIEGLFGAPYQSISTRNMIDEGYASDLLIKCIVLKYSEEESKEFHKPILDHKTGKSRKRTYHEEVEFLMNHERRNKFIKNLALSLNGNKLVFFRRVEHGAILKELLDNKENVFYIDGGIGAVERESIRQAIESEDGAILLASIGTSSTGVSIKKLHHMIAASPSKSKVTVLQSIGRMLRQHDTKEKAVLYDIVDDIRYKGKKNYTLGHFEERIKMYNTENHKYKIYNVKL